MSLEQDMDYIAKWCGIHGTGARLQEALEGIPPDIDGS